MWHFKSAMKFLFYLSMIQHFGRIWVVKEFLSFCWYGINWSENCSAKNIFISIQTVCSCNVVAPIDDHVVPVCQPMSWAVCDRPHTASCYLCIATCPRIMRMHSHYECGPLQLVFFDRNGIFFIKNCALKAMHVEPCLAHWDHLLVRNQQCFHKDLTCNDLN